MKIEKVKNLVTNLHDKTEYIIHIEKSKQALNHELSLKKVIKFNQNAWLEPYNDVNTKFRQKAKKYFEEDFFKLINNAIFGKALENVRKK